MQIFAAVVEAKSFSAAGQRLGISTAVISRRVAKLEKQLGVRLLNRTTRQLSMTEAGATLYDYCRRMVKEAEEATAALADLQARPFGKLRVSAPSAFSLLHLVPALPSFLACYPGLEVDLKIHDRAAQLEEEGYEVVIRIGHEPNPTEVGRPLAPLRKLVCASPAYLQRHGSPEKPDDLSGHDCLLYFDGKVQDIWLFGERENRMGIRVKGTICINNELALLNLAQAGQGLVCLPTYVVYEALATGSLRALLVSDTPGIGSIYAVYLPDHRISPRVRAFVDFFSDRFGFPTYWDQGILAGLNP